MEIDTSGLELVDYVRNELKNNSTRLICEPVNLGKPGEISSKYDINDYKSKTELTSCVIWCSRITEGYRDLIELKRQ